MAKVTEAHRDARRRRILDAAAALFARSGLHQTSMADIVRESGISFGGIYGYFASKDDIIAATADERHRKEAELYARALALSDPVEALHQLVASYGRLLADPAERLQRRVGIHLWAEALCADSVHTLVTRGAEAARATVETLLRRAGAENRLVDGVDPAAAARSLVALFQGYVLQLSWSEESDTESYTRTVRLLLDAMVRPAPSAEPH